MRLYLEPDEGSDAGRQLLLETPLGSHRDNPDWDPLQLCLTEEGSDGTLCFSLRLAGENSLQPAPELRVGMPVARAPPKQRPARQAALSRSNTMARIKASLSSARNAVVPTRTPPLLLPAARIGVAADSSRKLGIVREIRDDTNPKPIGVNFRGSDGDDLTWVAAEELDILFVADRLQSVVVECWEGGHLDISAPAFIGSCCSTVGELASGRARLLFLSNSELLGTWPLTIKTRADKNGFSLGRPQTLRARSSAQCHAWKDAISQAAFQTQHWARYHKTSPLQALCMRVYDVTCAVNESLAFLFLVYLAILASFVKSIVHFELAPNGALSPSHPEHARLQSFEHSMAVFELFFAVIFSLDLLVNFVANGWQRFFRDFYNYLDVFVVIASWVETALYYAPDLGTSEDLSGTIAMRVVRLLRLARVLRLSRLFVDVQILLRALSRSISGLLAAVLFLLLFTVLGAIMATSLFSLRDPDLFGKFSVSLFTMWSVGLGPATAFDVATSLMKPLGADEPETTDSTDNFVVGLFFGTYCFLVYAVFSNMVVVVFFREFLASTSEMRREHALEDARRRQHLAGERGLSSPLAPLLQVPQKSPAMIKRALRKSHTDMLELQEMVRFRDRQELSRMIREVYELLQPQPGAEVGFHEAQHGLRTALIHISKDDWLHLTDGLLRPGKETLRYANRSLHYP